MLVSRFKLCKLLSALNLPSGKSYAYKNLSGQRKGQSIIGKGEGLMEQNQPAPGKFIHLLQSSGKAILL